VLGVTLALGLATAVSLGLARFSYALLLPPMRADLGWSYLTAGALNTANAAGYLLGALLLPALLRSVDARRVMLAGGVGTALLLAAHGMVLDTDALVVLRALAGALSAASFVAGGLLAAWCWASTTAALARASSSRRCWFRRLLGDPCCTPGKLPGSRSPESRCSPRRSPPA
jgi:predicted MFS family arabinose efflux permease